HRWFLDRWNRRCRDGRRERRVVPAGGSRGRDCGHGTLNSGYRARPGGENAPWYFTARATPILRVPCPARFGSGGNPSRAPGPDWWCHGGISEPGRSPGLKRVPRRDQRSATEFCIVGSYFMMRNSVGVQAVERALAILRLFTPQCPELDLAEVSRRAGLPKSTCHRLIRTLGRSGFVIEGDGYGRYRLGLAPAQLGNAATALLRPSEAVRAQMRELNARLQDTIGLTRLHGERVLVLDRVESPFPFRMDYGIGALLPVHSTASGKVLLAMSESGD